jgi:hypothetical protein
MHRFFIIWFAFVVSVIAQEPVKESKGDIRVRLLAIVAPPELGQVYLLSGETKSPAFDLPTNNVSEPITVTLRALQLKTSSKDTNLATITLPEAGKRFVVILIPIPAGGYSPYIIRTDELSFKKGDCFFLNLSHKQIIGKLGTKDLSLEPGKSAIERPAGARKENYYDIAFASKEGDDTRILSTSRWPVDEQIRSYLFFYEDASGSITYRAVDEFVVEEK